MTAPNHTIWEIEPRTRAKHEILRRYLQAWFPILAKRHPRIVYLDGFAGPGRYSNGEEGSPIIALNAARSQYAHLKSSEPVFVFVEDDIARAKHLAEVEIPALRLPGHFRVLTPAGTFEATLTALLDDLDQKKHEIAPTFALVDPFGITGLPFALISRLLGRPHCEILVTFMTHTIQRFVDQLPEHINNLVGRPDAAALISRAPDRATKARELYCDALRSKARFVHCFNMYNTQGKVIYNLVFATQHPLGYLRMKEAMWAVDGSGDFSLKEGKDPDQLTLLSPVPAVDLAKILLSEFAGRRVNSSIVRSFVIEDTVYIGSHMTESLRIMEEEQRIVVEPARADGKKRRRGSFPDGTLVNFPRDRIRS